MGESRTLQVFAEPGSEALWVAREEPPIGLDAGEEMVEIPADPLKDNLVLPLFGDRGLFPPPES